MQGTSRDAPGVVDDSEEIGAGTGPCTPTFRFADAADLHETRDGDDARAGLPVRVAPDQTRRAVLQEARDHS